MILEFISYNSLEKGHTMTATHIVDPAGLLGELLAEASPDLMRHLLQTVINELMSADAEAVAGPSTAAQTPPGGPAQRLPTSTSRHPCWDLGHRCPETTPGHLLPRVAAGTSQARRVRLDHRCCDCYLAGVSTRRMDKLVKTLGIDRLSKSQVSRMAADLDEHVAEFRHRPLTDAGPFTFVTADALTMKVREGGRVINAVVMLATGVNNDGHREVLGMRVTTA